MTSQFVSMLVDGFTMFQPEKKKKQKLRDPHPIIPRVSIPASCTANGIPCPSSEELPGSLVVVGHQHVPALWICVPGPK